MAYASLLEFKSYKGIAVADTEQDKLLTMLIPTAQRYIDIVTRRTFEATADTTKYFDADRDTNGLSLDWTPYGLDLCAITSVVNGNGETITSPRYVLEPRHHTPWYGLRLKKSSGMYWQYDNADDPENAIAITGRWAYSLYPDDAIKQATLILVNFLFTQKDGSTFDAIGYPDAGLSDMPSGIASTVTELLKPYRRLV